jgi:DNA-binding winged helix-turn-helix (wHTH) protein/tetratricopeptide (TPR) repeat protein
MRESGERGTCRFGVYEFNLRAHELRKHGVQVRLRGQAFELLAMLLERPGEVVSREEMQTRLWPGDTFVDFERSLNSAIRKLRAVLGDSPERPMYLETIPRVGYRFIAPVRVLDPAPPTAVPPSAAAGTRETPGPESPDVAAAPPRVRRRHVAAWIASGFAVAAGAAFLTWLARPSRPVLLETDREILADLTNDTGEPVFDSSLSQALRVVLSESPYLNLVPDAAVRRPLKGETPATPVLRVTKERARRACEVVGATAVLTAELSRTRGGYRVGLMASRCSDGHVLTQVREEAASGDQVLETLDHVARAFRLQLGEPEATVSRFETPVARTTSASLTALRAFAQGEEKRAAGLDQESVNDYEIAAELDPQFALAHARLGTVYGNAQEWDLSRRHFTRAFELRARVSERERLYITAHYFSAMSGDEKTVETYELWRQVYPRDVVAPNNLSAIHYRTGRLEKAVAAARTAVRLDPGNAFCNLGLARALQRSGAYPEAKSLFERAVAAGNDGILIHQMRYVIAFGEDDRAAMEEQLKWAHGRPREGEMLDAAAWGSMASGKFAEGRKLFREASRIGLQHGLKEYAALVLLDDAQAEADAGVNGEARRDVEEALRLSGDSAMVQAFAALPLARLGEVSRARALSDQAAKAAPHDTGLESVTLPTIGALLELAKGDADGAVRLLEPVRPYDLGTDSQLVTIWYRGRAFLALRRFGEAEKEFQRLLSARLVNPNSPYLALARLGVAEARQGTGDRAAARAGFEAFLAAPGCRPARGRSRRRGCGSGRG